ncbi:MAG TPA: alcohol dehydrogenase catalytic domain-containing protein [Limnochordia bacterium]|nr:alcohol dehydrogenase catalytic domain-containing protein [Limnochordia bacterium]
MRAVVLEEPRRVAALQRPEPQPTPQQALVRLRTGGICGSDLAAYRGQSPLVSYPRVLGHELVVDVRECPSQPELVGKRAVIEPLAPCGRCRACLLGRRNCCMRLQVMGVHIDGGFSDRFAVDVQQLYAVPDEMPDELAALAEPTSIAYRAVQRAEITAGRVAVVFGAGTIGLLIASLLINARGCRVLVIDLDPRRLAVAERIGATPVAGDREALMQAVAQATGGDGADVVFEATGSAACTRLTTDLVAHAGRIVLIGWNKGPVEFDTVTLMRKEAEVYGSRNSVGAFPSVLRLLADGAVDPGIFVTHRFALDEAERALQLLDHGDELALKILLQAG